VKLNFLDGGCRWICNVLRSRHWTQSSGHIDQVFRLGNQMIIGRHMMSVTPKVVFGSPILPCNQITASIDYVSCHLV
jgi:hypothetical protein